MSGLANIKVEFFQNLVLTAKGLENRIFFRTIARNGKELVHSPSTGYHRIRFAVHALQLAYPGFWVTQHGTSWVLSNGIDHIPVLVRRGQNIQLRELEL